MRQAPEGSPIDGYSNSVRRRRFVGLQWKGFLWMSCLLIALSAAFYWLSHSHLMRQYHAQRVAEAQSFRRQMSGLLAGISDRLVRLGGTLVSVETVVATFNPGNPGKNSAAATTARFAGLGYELDVQRIEFYTPVSAQKL